MATIENQKWQTKAASEVFDNVGMTAYYMVKNQVRGKGQISSYKNRSNPKIIFNEKIYIVVNFSHF